MTATLTQTRSAHTPTTHPADAVPGVAGAPDRDARHKPGHAGTRGIGRRRREDERRDTGRRGPDKGLHAAAASPEVIVVQKTETLRDVGVAAPGRQRLREGYHVALDIGHHEGRGAGLDVPRLVFGERVRSACGPRTERVFESRVGSAWGWSPKRAKQC